MSDYRLTIQRVEPNPKYDAAYSRTYQQEQPTLQTQVLDVIVTAEQFDAIRRAVLEVVK